jgi:hypothetical protein
MIFHLVMISFYTLKHLYINIHFSLFCDIWCYEQLFCLILIFSEHIYLLEYVVRKMSRLPSDANLER